MKFNKVLLIGLIILFMIPLVSATDTIVSDTFTRGAGNLAGSSADSGQTWAGSTAWQTTSVNVANSTTTTGSTYLPLSYFITQNVLGNSSNYNFSIDLTSIEGGSGSRGFVVSNGTNTNIMGCQYNLGGSDNIQCINASGGSFSNIGITPSDLQWRKFEFVDINFTARTYSLRINGVSLAFNLTMGGTASNSVGFNNISLSQATSTMYMLADNLTLLVSITPTLNNFNIGAYDFYTNTTLYNLSALISNNNNTLNYNPFDYLSAWYTLDSNTQTTPDNSGNSNTGTLNGWTFANANITNPINPSSPPEYVRSPFGFGNAYNFTTNGSRLDTGRVIDYNNVSFTMCAWVQPFNFTGNSQNRVIINSYPGSSPTVELSINSAGRPLFSTRNSTTTTSSLNSSFQMYGVNTYICGVVDRNNNRQTLWLNGILHDNDSIATGNISPTVSLKIGSGSTGATTVSQFNGTIDEVRFWNVSLTSAQILQEMNNPFPVNGNGLVASYSFESNFTNATGNYTYDTNNLVTGQINGSFRFDGVGTVITNSTSSVPTLTTAGTMSLWVKWIKKNNGANSRPIDKNGNYYLEVIDSSGRVDCSYQGLSDNYLVGTGFTLTQDTWTYITCVYNGTNVSLYKNGVFVIGEPSTGSITSTASVFRIGSEGGTRWWNGSIDDVRIYNTSLSASQIQQLYQAGVYRIYNYSTTNGTINTKIPSSKTTPYNITLSSSDNSGYFSQFFANYNASTNLQARLAQSIINFTAYEIITNNSIPFANFSTQYITNTTHYMRAGTYTLNITTPYSFFNISNYNITILPLETKEIQIILWARNITFKDNISTVSILPSCYQNLTTSYWQYNTSTDYSMMPNSTNPLECLLFGYASRNINNSTRPDNATYTLQPATLTITFTQATSGYIQTLNNVSVFNNTLSLFTTQNNFSTGYVTIVFNPLTGNGTNISDFQQVYKYYNNQNTTISDTLKIETINLVKTFKVVNNAAPITNARVCTQLPHNFVGYTEWTSTQCDFTDSNGEVDINVHDQQQYKVCVQADGYTAKCFLVYIPPADQTTTSLQMTASTVYSGFNSIYSNCSSIYINNQSCTLTIQTYRPYYSICILSYENNVYQDIDCDYDSVGTTFNFNLISPTNYSLITQLDGVTVKNNSYFYSFFVAQPNKTISFDNIRNNESQSINDLYKTNKTYYSFIHLFAFVIILIASYGIDKKFNGYGVYGFGLMSIIMATAGLYGFWIPAIIISVYFLTEKVLPIITK